MDGAPGAGTPELEVRLLGPIEVSRESVPISLGGQKPRALLAVLALESRLVVSGDRLVEALWPGDPPDTAAHAVQVYVSQLRKALGPVITTRAPGYALELEPERIDIHRFTQLAAEGRASNAAGDPAGAEVALREALGLWRGTALADFVYEPFAQAEIARLEELRAGVLEERIEADLALGRHAELTPELEALVESEPLRERPRAQLMLALYRSGRQADALAAYRDARDTLVERLGIDPGWELKELEAAILRQDAALRLEDSAAPKPAMRLRRLAAIVSIDVVDAMALGETLDAEALADLERRYLEVVAEAITRHGGAIEAHVGDAVTAAFGTSVAHEDDALRAARAAIDLQVMIEELNTRLADELGVRLRLRIGIALGEVVASRTTFGRRVLAGDPVGIAATLQHAARPGEIVVGEIVARLIDHAAALEPYGSIEVTGRSKPFLTFRLLGLEEASHVFGPRRDAPLVGRKRELAALRRSVKRAIGGGRARLVLVTAPVGVGKSRLAAELARRTRATTTLWGRCLPYGEGITYWPLREMLASAPECDERAAVIAALEGEGARPAPEIALLFRRFCEALARERPLLVVFDDVHWAEPTFLDLVRHLGEKGAGPILLVCLARDELLDEHPGFLDGLDDVDRIVLDTLSVDEAETLLDGLGGAALESDQRARIADAAEGNPLFLEQLRALALEGGLTADGPLPATVQALLAARLDRLGPGERAVLERAAVVGRRFTLDDVVALLDPEALPTATAHLDALIARGFVRADEGRDLRFRHVLVQEAVYRATPKHLRAELHERYADRLDARSPELPDLDEFVGYHLEQALVLRRELGERDRRADRLAEDAGLRLGDAGIRALKRVDIPASRALLRRATALLPDGHPRRGVLLQDLGIALEAAGEREAAIAAHEAAIASARRAGDRSTEVSALVELEHVRLPRTADSTADALLAATAAAIPVLEAAGDHRRVGRALLFEGWVHGGRRGQQEARREAAERALFHYRQSTWPLSTCVGEIANALYYGPTPVVEAIRRCEELLAEQAVNRYGEANVAAFLGGLVAQVGDFERARGLVATAVAAYDDLGHSVAHGTFGGVPADVESIAGDVRAAEEMLRRLCADFLNQRAFSRLASRAGDLAEALYRQDRLDEAAGWVAEAEKHTASDDIDAKVLWMPVAAKLAARRQDFGGAMRLGYEAVSIAESGDALNRTAKAKLDLAEVLVLTDRPERARRERESSLALYEHKGNVIEAERVRALLGVVTVA